MTGQENSSGLWSAVATLTAGVLLCCVAQAQVCEKFRDLPPEQQTQILASADRSDPDCTVFIIRNLGIKQYEPATGILAKYLDFKWRDAPVRQMEQLWEIDKFPAFDALYSIGEKSAPAVIEYLGSRDLSGTELSRNVWLVVGVLERREHDLPKGVRALARASRAAKDPIIAGRLWRATMEAVALCSAPACQAVLIERPNQ
jgi:hypothetical protein